MSSARWWSAGLRAARANLLPGLIIWAACAMVVAAYYLWPAAHPLFDRLAAAKQTYGYAFSVVTAVLSGALLPEALKVLCFQNGRLRKENIADIIFMLPFWALQGCTVDLFYRYQAIWFGDAPTLATLTHKVLVDQFGYSAFYAAPFAATCFEWKHRGYRGPWRHYFSAAFYQKTVLPTLVANWGVWIPVVCAIYSLPSLLQFPLFALVLSFWSLMLTFITAEAAGLTS